MRTSRTPRPIDSFLPMDRHYVEWITAGTVGDGHPRLTCREHLSSNVFEDHRRVSDGGTTPYGRGNAVLPGGFDRERRAAMPHRSGAVVSLLVLFIALLAAPAAHAAPVVVTNGSQFTDTSGELVHA